MVPFKQIPVTFPENDTPPKRMIRDIIGTFLPSEWPSTDPETLKISLKTHFTNRHCIVQRPPSVKDSATEPLKLFIKIFNKSESGIDIFRSLVLTKEQEATLCEEYSLSGCGAKVYGLFRTEDGTAGRIDEFLDARNMEPVDVEDAVIRADVAVAMARFHTVRPSLLETPVAAYYDAVLPGLRRFYGMERLRTLAREGGVPLDDMIDYNFAGRIQGVIEAMEAIAAKSAWCIHDVQFMNTMVKNNPQPGESRVVLIDFEMVMRNYRGFDIGGHFMQKLFKWFDEESKIARCRPYTADEKRDFCRCYVQEWNRLTGDDDTAEHVLREAEYGYLLAVTFDVHNMLWFMNKISDKDPLNLEGLRKLFDEIVEQCSSLGFREPGET